MEATLTKYQELRDFLQSDKTATRNLIITFSDGTTEEGRFFHTTGSIGKLRPKCRRKGAYWYTSKVITGFSEKGKKSVKEVAPYEKALRNFKNYQKKMTELHPNLWHNFRDGYKAVDLAELEEKLRLAHENATEEDKKWDLMSYYVLREIPNVLSENSYKSISIESTMKGLGSYVVKDYMAQIKEALDNRKNVRLNWRTNYDYSIEITFDELNSDTFVPYGRAFFSQEYKGCGNGYYWFLINETTAVFGEKD